MVCSKNSQHTSAADLVGIPFLNSGIVIEFGDPIKLNYAGKLPGRFGFLLAWRENHGR
jgi:hypothetical protein